MPLEPTLTYSIYTKYNNLIFLFFFFDMDTKMKKKNINEKKEKCFVDKVFPKESYDNYAVDLCIHYIQ